MSLIVLRDGSVIQLCRGLARAPGPSPVATGEGGEKVLAADGTAGGEAVDLRGADGDDVGPDLAEVVLVGREGVTGDVGGGA